MRAGSREGHEEWVTARTYQKPIPESRPLSPGGGGPRAERVSTTVPKIRKSPLLYPPLD